MHELSLSIALVESILDIAKDKDLKKIDEVHLECGELKEVVPSIMQDAFKTATKDTLAEKSILIIKEIQAKAKCNDCGNIFRPEKDYYICSKCNSTNVKIVQGQDLIIKSLISERG